MHNAIEITQLGKRYKKNPLRHRSNFREDILYGWKRLLNKNIQQQEETIALEGVSFELEKGDVLGIIGRNGAGKTTLLKMLAGIVQPTAGSITYRGRLVSILDFGTGFHPDLTGRENIYLNGSLLGMSKPELQRKYEAIVAFSELNDCIDEPVKHYSSGMYLRLAFAVFSHLESDIFLLDEVISVGDLPFRQKCHQRISQLAGSGVTLVMASHYPDQIKELCNKCLWLEGGRVQAFGAAGEVLDEYLEKHLINGRVNGEAASFSINNYFLRWHEGLPVKNVIRIFRYGVKARNKREDAPILMTDDLEIDIEFEKLQGGDSVEVTLSILSLYEAWVLVDSYAIYSRFEKQVWQKGRYGCKCFIGGGILNFGIYQLGLLVSRSEELIYQNPYMLNFHIQFLEQDGIRNKLARETKSIIKPIGIWEVEKR